MSDASGDEPAVAEWACAPRPAADAVSVALVDRYVEEIARRLGGFDPERSVSARPDEMSPPAGIFLVGTLRGAPVACGGLKRISDGEVEIKRMYVAPEARGRGLGAKLLAALEAEARRLGARRVVLDTSDPLVEATALYRRAGYVEVEPYNDNRYATRWFAKELWPGSPHAASDDEPHESP